jgi:peptidoglycan/LPS O-acetylase OafA/YrhL
MANIINLGNSRYRADIQGLRAIAIVPVVLFHANEDWITGGFVGVDVFFVISGFLITQIVLRDLEDGKYSIVAFYKRRIVRIFPALYVMMVAVLVAGFFLLGPEGLRLLGSSAVATVGFLSNIEFLRRASYFGADAQYEPLLHTWSLAVEEQFYILFPPLLAMLWKTNRSRIGPCLMVLAVGSLALCLWLLQRHPTAAFYLAPARAYELLIGAAVAAGAIPRFRSAMARDLASICGLALIGSSMIALDADSTFPGLAALVPCIGAAMVIHAGMDGETWGGRLISVRPMVLIGSLSYSLYLWHWPMFVYARHYQLRALTSPEAVALVVAAAVAAYLSWKYVEQPVLRSGLRARGAFGFGGTAMIAAGTAAAVLFLSQGLPGRFSTESKQLFAAKDNFAVRARKCHSADTTIPYETSCVFGAPNAVPDTVVWGDSHGVELSEALGERMALDGRALIQVTTSGCPPILNFLTGYNVDCAKLNDTNMTKIASDERIREVILVANHASFENKAEKAAGMVASARQLIRSGKRVVISLPLPLFDYDVPTALGMTVARGDHAASYEMPRDAYEQANANSSAAIREASQKVGYSTFDPASVLCDEDSCSAYTPAAGSLYFNRSHLSMAGARMVAAIVAPKLALSSR